MLPNITKLLSMSLISKWLTVVFDFLIVEVSHFVLWVISGVLHADLALKAQVNRSHLSFVLPYISTVKSQIQIAGSR